MKLSPPSQTFPVGSSSAPRSVQTSGAPRSNRARAIDRQNSSDLWVGSKVSLPGVRPAPAAGISFAFRNLSAEHQSPG